MKVGISGTGMAGGEGVLASFPLASCEEEQGALRDSARVLCDGVEKSDEGQ